MFEISTAYEKIIYHDHIPCKPYNNIGFVALGLVLFCSIGFGFDQNSIHPNLSLKQSSLTNAFRCPTTEGCYLYNIASGMNKNWKSTMKSAEIWLIRGFEQFILAHSTYLWGSMTQHWVNKYWHLYYPHVHRYCGPLRDPARG